MLYNDLDGCSRGRDICVHIADLLIVQKRPTQHWQSNYTLIKKGKNGWHESPACKE